MVCRIGNACEKVTWEVVAGAGERSGASTGGGGERRGTTVGGWAWTGVIDDVGREEGGAPNVGGEKGRGMHARMAATSSRSRWFSALRAATSRRSCFKALPSCSNWAWSGAKGGRGGG